MTNAAGGDAITAGQTASNAAINNYLSPKEADEYLAAKKKNADSAWKLVKDAATEIKYSTLSANNTNEAIQATGADTRQALQDLQSAKSYYEQKLQGCTDNCDFFRNQLGQVNLLLPIEQGKVSVQQTIGVQVGLQNATNNLAASAAFLGFGPAAAVDAISGNDKATTAVGDALTALQAKNAANNQFMADAPLTGKAGKFVGEYGPGIATSAVAPTIGVPLLVAQGNTATATGVINAGGTTADAYAALGVQNAINLGTAGLMGPASSWLTQAGVNATGRAVIGGTTMAAAGEAGNFGLTTWFAGQGKGDVATLFEPSAHGFLLNAAIGAGTARVATVAPTVPVETQATRPANLVSGSTGTVGSGASAANDASFNVSKTPEVSVPAQTPSTMSPAVGRLTIQDIAGPTSFVSAPISQVPSKLPASERLGQFGEVELAKPDSLSPGYRPLQNASGNGSDGLGIPDASTKTIPAFEVKTTDTGNRQSVGDLVTRTERWINDAASGKINSQVLSNADQQFAQDLRDKLRQGYSIKPYVVEVAVPAIGQSASPVVTVTPYPRPSRMPTPTTAPFVAPPTTPSP